MIGTVVMRPGLISIVAGVPHDQSTPSNWAPSITSVHPAKSVVFSTPGVYQFVVPLWVKEVMRQVQGAGGGGGGASQFGGAGGGVGGWFCQDTIPTQGGELWTVTVGVGGNGGAELVNGTGGGDSSVTGMPTLILAPGGRHGNRATLSAVGAPASGTSGSAPIGQIIHEGGGGGGGLADQGGGGGGASAGFSANGGAGENGVVGGGSLGGVAPTGGGDGGAGALLNEAGEAGFAPGGGGGGTSYDPGGTLGGNGAPGQVRITWGPTE